MSDNRRPYHHVRKALKTCYPFEPEGQLARHLNTLAGLVSGIVSSGRTNLPQIAAKVPDSTQAESRVKRFSRLLENERIDWETLFPSPCAVAVGRVGRCALVLGHRCECRGTGLCHVDAQRSL